MANEFQRAMKKILKMPDEMTGFYRFRLELNDTGTAMKRSYTLDELKELHQRTQFRDVVTQVTTYNTNQAVMSRFMNGVYTAPNVDVAPDDFI